MAKIDKNGMLVDNRIIPRRFKNLEHGTLNVVNAIVVHQTDSWTEQATFNGYAAAKNGAHFLIATGGAIYQTASIRCRCYHVGEYLKSRCVAITPKNCTDQRCKTRNDAAQQFRD